MFLYLLFANGVKVSESTDYQAIMAEANRYRLNSAGMVLEVIGIPNGTYQNVTASGTP